MKIAILTPTFYKYSGPDRVAENEALEYSRKGHKVTVITLNAEIAPKGYEVIELGMPKNHAVQRIYKLLFFLDIFKIEKSAKMLREFDEIICFMYPMTVIATTASKYYHKKYVYYNMGVAYPRLFENPLERAYMRLFNLFTNFTVKNADSSISISDFLRKELKRETRLDGKVKYVFVDPKIYNAKKSEKTDAVRKKHKLGKNTLLFVGRLSPHKGVHLLLDAFAKVRKEVPDTKLLIVGKATFDSYSKNLEKKTQEIGNAIMAGFVPDEELPYYFKACDVYATATRWEGFDIPAVCAQMCKKPVVAFDVGSHPEVVKNGILARDGDVDGLARGIVKCLKKQKK